MILAVVGTRHGATGYYVGAIGGLRNVAVTGLPKGLPLENHTLMPVKF